MRKTSKILSVFLTLCLLLSLLPTAAFAADVPDAGAGVKITQESYDAGTRILTVNLQVKIPANEGVNTLGALISYDSAQLTLMHKKNDTSYAPTETKTSVTNAVKVALQTEETQEVGDIEIPYSYDVVNADLYGKGGRAALFVGMGCPAGKNPSAAQQGTDYMTAFQLRFKVAGTAAAEEILNSNSLRIADPVKDQEVVEGAYGTNDSTIINLATKTSANRYRYGKMSGYSGEFDGVSGNGALLAAEGNATATYPGSTNTPPKDPYTGTAATISKVEKVGSNVEVTASVPATETAQYGYSTTNSAASVENWQDGNSFAVPTEPGDYYFFARVKETEDHQPGGESAGTKFTVNGPISLSYTAPASMTVGTAIADMMPVVSGGSGSYTGYAVTSGTLPAGLDIVPATGKIYGTPTAASETGAQVTVTVTDSESSTKAYTITFPAVGKMANTMDSVTQANVEYGTAVNPSATSNGTAPTFAYKVKGADDITYSSEKPTAVGEYTVKASSTGHATVANAVVTTDFAITQKTLNNLGFTGVTVTKVYDGTTSAGAVGGTGITFDGTIGSDDVSIKAVAGEYTDANAGPGKTVTLTLSLDGTDKDNYKLASYSETFNTAAITAADYTYTVAATQTFRTGSGLSAITVAPATGTGVNGESVTGTLKWYTDGACYNVATDYTLSSVAANSSMTLYWKFTATDTNYTTTSKTGSTVFTAKNKDDLSTSIDVSGITGLSKTYDGAAASYTGSATVTGHTGLDSSLVYEWYKADNTKLAEAPKNVGSYYLKVSIPDANPDYIGSAKVDFTISKREVTVAAGTYKVSKTYDGTVNVGSATVTGALSVSGILPADSGVTVKATPVDYTSNSVGAQTTMDINIELDGTGKENYKIKDGAATVTVTCEITARPITIASATATNRDYAEGNVSVVTDVILTGAIGTLTKDVDYTVTGAMTDANAGTDKTVNVTVTLTNDNYSLAANTTTTTVTINTIAYAGSTSTTGSAKYGATGSVDLRGYLAEGGSFGTVTKTDTEGVLSGTPAMNGDSLEFTFVNDAGKATKTATIKVPVTGATNYNDYEISVEVTVLAKSAQSDFKFASATQAKTYGDADFTVAATGAVSGSTVTYVSSDTSVATVESGTGKVHILKVGTTVITATASATDDYAAKDVQYTLTVSQKDVTVAPKSFTITKGSAIPTFELVYTGLVGSDTLTPSDTPVFTCYEADGTTPVSTTTAAGAYTITWTNKGATTFTGADNYNVTKTATGTLTINNPAPSGDGGVTTYSITADSAQNGTVTISPKSAAKGATVTITVKPDKGYTLETITVTDKNGDEIELTNKGDGKYTFKMPASKVYVEATFMEDNSMLNFFVDVPADAYYYDAVLWAAENGITGGVDDTHFAPNATCTRAQIVTFLWRAAGSPEPENMSSFADVSADSYYAKAVAWAVEQGITTGTGDGKFSPNAPCTRAQSVTFLWRSQKSPAADTVNPFTDVAADSYYANAVLWAAENGITGGTSATTFSPNNNCTRAQIVTFLYRCLGK